MTQGRKSNGQFGKKVKATPLPARKRKAAPKVLDRRGMTIEYMLALAEFSWRLLRRIEALEAKAKTKKYPQDISK